MELLKINSLKELWKAEFLPNIRHEIRLEVQHEIDKLNASMSELNHRFNKVEESQQMLSDKYDHFLELLQSSKKQILELEKSVATQKDEINKLKSSLYRIESGHG
jgi:chromosome segregation ATPase